VNISTRDLADAKAEYQRARTEIEADQQLRRDFQSVEKKGGRDP
jgi:hypothetical protein